VIAPRRQVAPLEYIDGHAATALAKPSLQEGQKADIMSAINPEVMMEDALSLLAAVRNRLTQREVATALDVDARTVRRWETRQTDPPQFLADAIRQRLLPAERLFSEAAHGFKFIDLFAGIGGIRRGFEAHGGKCVFTSEWDSWAQKTYLANNPDSAHSIHGDITQIDAADIPDHDVLLAGFPCQPFSIAGVSKKNALGRAHGFADETQGTLFFDVARIIANKQPKAFLLENVKNLRTHDKGNTFRVIEKVLTKDLGYQVTAEIIDGASFVPQHRERLLIVGFREATDFSWDDLRLPATGPLLESILHPQDGSEDPEKDFTMGPKAKVNPKYTLTEHLWGYLQAYAAKHRAAGNGFGYGLVTGKSIARTLSARYYKDGSEILVSQGARKRPRRLTPRECARLMGFDDDFKIVVSDTQAYKQFGNSVVVPVIKEVARIMVPRVLDLIQQERDGIRQEPLLVS
jgi:DNA (cytosine-5)-methyltransferase 1